ncbi:MAG: FAD-dependent oxidoreductase [Mycobacterium sp.]|nr:FAD-dependent oxidoreductase [Mycobacterium sp.]
MTDVAEVVVIGSGFAGLWAALGAARRLEELAVPAGSVDITVLSRKPFHDIRVRNYETDLAACRIPLSDVLDPAGVGHIADEVMTIDTENRTVTTATGRTHRYDRLVLASGSQVVKPDIPGLREFGFDVDTYEGAAALGRHLRRLAEGQPTPASATAVVVGAGLTGIEAACELPHRLAPICAGRRARVLLVDRNPWVGSDMGIAARPVIENALFDNGIEVRTGLSVAAVSKDGVSLSSGEQMDAATVIWCAGMRASSLTEQLPAARDRLGRVPVDGYLRVIGVPGVFAAGDVAAAQMDDDHLSVRSCQHGRPMGRFAGYNVISDLRGEAMLPLRIPWYVTVLDLGPAGAVYTEGWNRDVVSCGAAAKAIKQTINTRRIYPPLMRDRAALLAAAAPQLQDWP